MRRNPNESELIGHMMENMLCVRELDLSCEHMHLIHLPSSSILTQTYSINDWCSLVVGYE
jgi:hypothetical protein